MGSQPWRCSDECAASCVAVDSARRAAGRRARPPAAPYSRKNRRPGLGKAAPRARAPLQLPAVPCGALSPARLRALRSGPQEEVHEAPQVAIRGLEELGHAEEDRLCSTESRGRGGARGAREGNKMKARQTDRA
jgi:hypothetical protein